MLVGHIKEDQGEAPSEHPLHQHCKDVWGIVQVHEALSGQACHSSWKALMSTTSTTGSHPLPSVCGRWWPGCSTNHAVSLWWICGLTPVLKLPAGLPSGALQG